MKHLLAAATALVLVTGNAQAMGCDEVDFALRGALQEALMGAEDRQVSGLALYLNEAFYTDLTCRLSKRHDRDAIDALIDDPEALMAEAMALTTSRNQSDALMLILMAMQATVDEEEGFRRGSAASTGWGLCPQTPGIFGARKRGMRVRRSGWR